MPKVLILENTAASGVMLSRGDVVDVSKDDALLLRHAGFATADEKRIADAEKAKHEAIADKVNAGRSRGSAKPEIEKAAANAAS